MTQDNLRMGDLNELVDRLNSAASIIEQWDAWELGAANKPTVRLSVSPSKSIREAAAALTSLIAEIDEARTLVAEANNSLYGSQGYFHSLNGGAFDKYHLATGIENLKSNSRKEWGRAEAAEAQLKAARELADGLNVTDEELVRINNMCVGFDGDVKIWAKMLQKLAVFAIAARTALSLDSNKGDGV